MDHFNTSPWYLEAHQRLVTTREQYFAAGRERAAWDAGIDHALDVLWEQWQLPGGGDRTLMDQQIAEMLDEAPDTMGVLSPRERAVVELEAMAAMPDEFMPKPWAPAGIAEPVA